MAAHAQAPRLRLVDGSCEQSMVVASGAFQGEFETDSGEATRNVEPSPSGALCENYQVLLSYLGFPSTKPP